MYVGDPLVRLTAVVAIEHAGHGVNTQAVKAKALQPVQRVADQKIAHFIAAEVVDQGVPVGVETLAAVSVFVEVGAVEMGQPKVIGGKVRGHPIEQHTHACCVGALDEPHKTSRVAVACCGRVKPQGLIAPRAIKRVLADGHQFQVGEAHVLCIGHQFIGQLVPVQPAIAFVGFAPPRRQMNLVNAHRRIQGIRRLALGTRGQFGRHAGHYAGVGRAQFGLAGVGVRLQRQQVAIPRMQLKFVACTGAHARHKTFPNTTRMAQVQSVNAAVPSIEVADHADAARVGRPDRKGRSGDTIDMPQMCAQHLVGPQVRALHQ